MGCRGRGKKAERANRGDKSHGHTPSSRVTSASRSLRLPQADGGQESQDPGQLEPGVQEDSPVSAHAAGPAHPAEVSTHTSGHRIEARASCTEAPMRAGVRKTLQAAPRGSATAPLPSLQLPPVLAENDDTARDDDGQGDSKQAVVAGSSGAGRQRRQVPTEGGCLHKDQAMQDPRQPERPAQCLWDRTQPARVQPARSSDQREHSLRCSIVSCATKGRPTERPSHSCQTATRKVASHPRAARRAPG